MTRRLRIDLIVVVCLSAATLVLAVVGVTVPGLMAALAGPFVFVLPGYALSMALFPRPGPHAELLLLSLGLSLAVASLGGLALNLTPWGVRAESWAGLLFLITLSASLVAAVRRHRGLLDPPQPVRLVLPQSQRAMFAAAALVVVGSVWIASQPPPQQPSQTYSVLWAVPASDAEPNTIHVGVDSGESETTAYVVRVLADAQQVQEFPIRLAPAGIWETDLALTGSGPLEVQLYKAEAPDVVYRRVEVRPRG